MTSVSSVTTKAEKATIEGFKVALSTPDAALTPATATALVGIYGNGPSSTASAKAVKDLTDYANTIANTDPILSSNIIATVTRMQSFSTTVRDNFPTIFMKACMHVSDALELRTSLDYMANISYKDLGSNIATPADLADQGLTKNLGNLKAVGQIVRTAGPIYGTKDMSLFGTPAGVIENLTRNKLANYTGLNAELTKLGVDKTQLTDPEYQPQIIAAMSRITDPTVLNTVKTQYRIPETNTIKSLADLTDVTKLGIPEIKYFTGNLKSIGTKMKDLNASFADSNIAASMLSNISYPITPALNTLAANMKSFVSNIRPSIDQITGVGSGPGGVPSVGDFFGLVTNDAVFSSLSSSANAGTINSSTLSSVGARLDSVESLFDKAGIEFYPKPTKPYINERAQVMHRPKTGFLDCIFRVMDHVYNIEGGLHDDTGGLIGDDFSPDDRRKIHEYFYIVEDLLRNNCYEMTKNLGAHLAIGTSLHKFGKEAIAASNPDLLGTTPSPLTGPTQSGYTGADQAISKLFSSGTYGEAVTAGLIEGKNKAIMAYSKIPPIKYT
jgi:hypothetical protein